MFSGMLEKFRSRSDHDDAQHRRTSARREGACVAEIGGRMYPVANWSQGGVLINADTRLFGVGQNADLTLRFQVENDVVDIPQHGKVVRKNPNQFALKFEEIDRETHRRFEKIIDHIATVEFVKSQSM